MKNGFFLLLGNLSLMTALSVYMLNANAVGVDSSTPNSNTTPNAPDSRFIIPPGNSTTVKPQYPGVNIPSSALPDNMDSLPKCPATPVCADINGKMPSGYKAPTKRSCSFDITTFKINCVDVPTNVSTCPDTCTVSRTVNEDKLSNGVVRITGSTAAVCPPGYSAAAVYNVGKEIGYQTNPPAAPFPVPDMATYQSYKASNYSCSLVAQPDPVNSCGEQVTTNIAGVDQVISNITVNSYSQFVYTSGVGQWTYNSNAGCYLKGVSNCSIASPCGDAYNMKYTYYYSYYKCTPPAGLYYTDNMTPTSLVCKITKAVWQTAQ